MKRESNSFSNKTLSLALRKECTGCPINSNIPANGLLNISLWIKEK